MANDDRLFDLRVDKNHSNFNKVTFGHFKQEYLRNVEKSNEVYEFYKKDHIPSHKYLICHTLSHKNITKI